MTQVFGWALFAYMIHMAVGVAGLLWVTRKPAVQSTVKVQVRKANIT